MSVAGAHQTDYSPASAGNPSEQLRFGQPAERLPSVRFRNESHPQESSSPSPDAAPAGRNNQTLRPQRHRHSAPQARSPSSAAEAASEIPLEASFQAIPARHDHDHFGLRRQHIFPLHPKGWIPRAPQNIDSARARHHLRHPMPRHIGRIEPFEANNARAGRPATARSTCCDIVLRIPPTTASACSERPVASPTVRISAQTSASECGLSVTMRGWRPQMSERRARSSGVAAHTWQRSCVTIRSGSIARQLPQNPRCRDFRRVREIREPDGQLPRRSPYAKCAT